MNEQDALTHEPMRPVVFFPHEKHVVKTIIREGISYIIEERNETYYSKNKTKQYDTNFLFEGPPRDGYGSLFGFLPS